VSKVAFSNARGRRAGYANSFGLLIGADLRERCAGGGFASSHRCTQEGRGSGWNRSDREPRSRAINEDKELP